MHSTEGAQNRSVLHWIWDIQREHTHRTNHWSPEHTGLLATTKPVNRLLRATHGRHTDTLTTEISHQAGRKPMASTSMTIFRPARLRYPNGSLQQGTSRIGTTTTEATHKAGRPRERFTHMQTMRPMCTPGEPAMPKHPRSNGATQQIMIIIRGKHGHKLDGRI